MSVNYSTTVGYGFVISPEGLAQIQAENEDEYIEELLDSIVPAGLTYVTAGSYYDNDEFTYAIGVERLTETFSNREGPSGIKMLTVPVLTVAEDNALYDLQIALLSEDMPVGNFHAGLWH